MLRNSKNCIVILSGLRSFVVMANEGAPENHYRINQQQVEFRTVAPAGPPRSDHPWRVLTPDELELHFALHTPVADWLDKTLYAQQQRHAA
jgi:hypothetical protein